MSLRRELAKLGALFRRSKPADDLAAEIRSHLEMEEQENLESGMPPEEAHYAALRRFGNVTLAQERSREMWGWNSLETLLQDFCYGLRQLRLSPGFTMVAVLTLALGIGANTTIFSWINATLLNPIPGVTHTSEMFALSRGGTARSAPSFSYLDYLDLRDRNRSFCALMASDIRPMDLTGAGRPERVWGTLATANYFDVLGVRPILGRGFLPGEEQKPGGAPVVVISYRLWQTHFGAEPSVLGRTVDVNHHPFSIVGIAPLAFQGSQTGLRSDLWIPMMMEEQVVSGGDRLHRRSSDWLELLGRLEPGISPPQAQQEMNLLMQQIVAQYPDAHPGRNDVTLHPLWRAPHGANAYFYILLPMLMAIAGVVLLLACANVANLLLIRSNARSREIAIRLSLGAGRSRLVRQFLAESLLLALAGGGVAALLTVWTAGTFAEFLPPTNLPISLDVRADRTVLLATLAISIVAAVIFGVLPALRSSRLAPVAALKEDLGTASGGLQKARLASALVVAQISLSLLLLICAGLFIRSFRKAQHLDPGFNPDHVLVASFDLFPAGYTPAEGGEFHRQLLAKLEALPGVLSVTLADWIPFGFITDSTTTKLEGYVPQAKESMNIREADVGPNYFRTMQIPLVAGRDFTPQDTSGSQPVVIINQALAERYWPHQNAMGKWLEAEGQRFAVVGIARTGNYDRLDETPQPFFYLPLFQDYSHDAIIHARVSGDPLAFASAVEKTVHELNADLPVVDVASLNSQVELASTNQRIAATFAGAFGLLALILATVGIYGVIAYATRQRTHEMGIRMALGAERVDVLRLVLGQGLRLTLIGLTVGLTMSWALTRFLRGVLFGVAATDPLTFAGVSVLLCFVALVASYIPARRATKVDPMVALRYE
jgi:predicted permease